jgi:hypothetical protein
MTSKKDIIRHHIHVRILMQLTLFITASIVLFGIVIYNVIQDNLNPVWLIAGIVLGILIGLIAGRMFAMRWHEDTRKVILGMDKMSILLLVLYIAFRFGTEQLFGKFIHGEELTVFTFSSLAGVMIGRLFSMVKGLSRVLKEQNIL